MQLTPRMIAQPKVKIATEEHPYNPTTQTRWDFSSLPPAMAMTVNGTRTYDPSTGRPHDADND